MTQRTKSQIVQYLKTAMPDITDPELSLIESREFKRDEVVKLAEAHGITNDRDIEDIVDSIDAMKNRGNTHVGPSPLPSPVTRVMGSKEQPRPKPPKVASGNANDRRWWIRGAAAVVTVLLTVLAVVLVSNCQGGYAKNGAMSVHKTDTASVNPDADVNNFDLVKRVEALETDMSNLDKKVDGVSENTAKLSGAVDELTNKVNEVVNKVNEIDCILDGKADKAELKSAKKRLKRVERKLDAHIASDHKVLDPYPEPVAPAQPTSNGTVTVIVRKVKVD